jgi:hypothetical protein
VVGRIAHPYCTPEAGTSVVVEEGIVGEEIPLLSPPHQILVQDHFGRGHEEGVHALDREC